MIRKLTFGEFMALEGRVVRSVPSRQTSQVLLDGQSFFIKKHLGVGWWEIFKNLLVGKRPIIDAHTERLAIQKLTQAGIKTTPLAAYGQRGSCPATRQSFLLTHDLGDILSIEDICLDCENHPPSVKLKRKLIREVALVTKRMHRAGIHHRDFYICHICFQQADLHAEQIPLIVIDLHRATAHSHLSVKAMIKDIAALYSSVMHVGLSKSDLMRFCSIYWDNLSDHKVRAMMRKIAHRAYQLDAKRVRKNLTPANG